MSRVLVFGAQGQLGAQLVEDLNLMGFDVVGLDRQEGDITQKGAISRAFLHYQPDLVFNAAAYNAVDKAQTQLDEAMAINALGPSLLAAACHDHEATFVHFSTDYVFGEGHSSPIHEGILPAPLSTYGQSKLLGEQLAIAGCRQTIIVRCCGLYGHRRANFVRTMVRAALRQKQLTVVQDQLVSPTWVEPLSKVAISLGKLKRYGVYHATAQGAMSWYDFAARIFDRLDLKVELTPTTQAQWGAPAPRPAYSVLDNMMLRLSLGHDPLEHCESMLDKFLAQHGQEILAQERQALTA